MSPIPRGAVKTRLSNEASKDGCGTLNDQADWFRMTPERVMGPLTKTITVRDRRFLLRVEDSPTSSDYQMYEDLREEVWGFPDDHMSSTRNMMCENVFHEGGSLFIGAFAEAPGGGFAPGARSLVGFCYGFVGVRDKEVGFRDPKNLRFYAQYAGVRKAFQSYGLGILLKDYQREMVLGLLGVPAIICTYDPLTGVNAHRNIHHFGMDVLEYRVATYGEYGGLLNRPDVPTDRFLMSWDLERTARRPGYDLEAALAAPRPVRAGLRRVAAKSGPAEFEVVEGTDPAAEGEALLVRIPLDFYRMLQETDIADDAVRRIPVDWRLATRDVLRGLFDRGYKVVDFLKAADGRPGNHYVLTRIPAGGPRP
jgi:predicted GNAT superfamily acetyltransferase